MEFLSFLFKQKFIDLVAVIVEKDQTAYICRMIMLYTLRKVNQWFDRNHVCDKTAFCNKILRSSYSFSIDPYLKTTMHGWCSLQSFRKHLERCIKCV